jgi:hypothetical protein
VPWAVRVTKVQRNARVVAQLLVQRYLKILVKGHAVAHRLCNAEQLICCKALKCVGLTNTISLELHDLPYNSAPLAGIAAGHLSGVARV